MKVKELIQRLSKCNPEAIVEVEDCESRAQVDDLEECWYDKPENCYVTFKSALSFEPNEARENQKELQKLRHVVKRIEKILDSR